jgi:S1-C subfamily serine protease
MAARATGYGDADRGEPMRTRPPVPAFIVVLSLALLLVGGACAPADQDDEAAPAEDTVPAEAADDGAADTEADTEEVFAREPGDVGFGDIPDIVDAVLGSVFAVQSPIGEGSGVVIDEGGIAVTNAHVVQDASSVDVVLATGERTTADVLGSDVFTDVAVLRLAGDDPPPPLELTEDLPRVGSMAIAIGNPLGFENTVTVGVVSGLERSIPGGGPALVGLIQTDAAISPGNSGGALVAANGRVIGVNVAQIPPELAGAGSIGFAIPSAVVLDVAERILAGEEITHPFLGILPLPLTPQLAEQLGLDEPGGVVVMEVVPDGPAAAAGLEPGDVILAVEDTEVATVGEFMRDLRDRAPGDTVSVRLWRRGQELEVSVTLGERPEDDLQPPVPEPPDPQPEQPQPGLPGLPAPGA